MSAQIGYTSLAGIHDENVQLGFLISGTVTEADIGKAVTLDSGAANTVKLAGDNDVILGRLMAYEDRTAEGIKMATVSMGVSMDFPINTDAVSSPTDETPAVGDYICGATLNAGGKGYVQKIATNGQQRWLVVELVSATKLVAVKV